MIPHTIETMRLAVAKVFEAAERIANEHGVGIVVVAIDAAERVRYQTNLGPTMTAGMLSRCAGLYDAKSAAGHNAIPQTLGLVTGGRVVTCGPGGGIGGTTHVVSDPPGHGGAGVTG